MTPASNPASPPVPPRVWPGLDALRAGCSVFDAPDTPPPPAVEGYGDWLFLGRGGLSHVWQATRLADGAPVALKAAALSGPESAERLRIEAAALRALEHPHIVRLLDVAEDPARGPVLVMELVDGPPLTALLPEEGFSWEETLGFLLPVLEAVEAAHRQGIVHRDLKPGNILVTADGRPKVSDFGLAVPLGQRPLAFSFTRSGLVAGTVEYLAPECYDPASEPAPAMDIFALGVLLYELLAGRPPRGAWKPLSLLKPLDVRLDALFAEAIAPDPSQRLASAAEFRRRLIEIRDSPPRLAGTPLVTRPVRALDGVWTLAGLYFLAAGYCSQQAINNTDVPGLFDLTFGHTQYLGGFWAVWITAMGLGLLGFWQAARLWRFRHVPLREALPSPFGLKLGASRGVAWLTAAAQALCFLGPLYYVFLIAAQTWHWITPETPVWQHALSVTKWGSEIPVSPWHWDPAALFQADEYWTKSFPLREAGIISSTARAFSSSSSRCSWPWALRASSLASWPLLPPGCAGGRAGGPGRF